MIGVERSVGGEVVDALGVARQALPLLLRGCWERLLAFYGWI